MFLFFTVCYWGIPVMHKHPIENICITIEEGKAPRKTASLFNISSYLIGCFLTAVVMETMNMQLNQDETHYSCSSYVPKHSCATGISNSDLSHNLSSLIIGIFYFILSFGFMHIKVRTFWDGLEKPVTTLWRFLFYFILLHFFSILKTVRPLLHEQLH